MTRKEEIDRLVSSLTASLDFTICELRAASYQELCADEIMHRDAHNWIRDVFHITQDILIYLDELKHLTNN